MEEFKASLVSAVFCSAAEAAVTAALQTGASSCADNVNARLGGTKAVEFPSF
jgi:hypothetical protein